MAGRSTFPNVELLLFELLLQLGDTDLVGRSSGGLLLMLLLMLLMLMLVLLLMTGGFAVLSVC